MGAAVIARIDSDVERIGNADHLQWSSVQFRAGHFNLDGYKSNLDAKTVARDRVLVVLELQR